MFPDEVSHLVVHSQDVAEVHTGLEQTKGREEIQTQKKKKGGQDLYGT